MKKRILIIIALLLNFYVVCNNNTNKNTKLIIKTPKKVKKDIDYWINKHSKIYNLDPKLVKAVIKFESNMNPNARNPKSSSYGLPQFIKSSGLWVYTELGYKNYNHYKTPYHIQIEMCCWYLNFLHKKYKGDSKKALMAYNGFELGDLYWKKVYRIKNDL